MFSVQGLRLICCWCHLTKIKSCSPCLDTLAAQTALCHLQYGTQGREIQSERSAITQRQNTHCSTEAKTENNIDWCWNRQSAGCCRKVDGHSDLIWSLTNNSGDRLSIKDQIWEWYLIWLSPKSKTQRFLMTSNREKLLLLTFKKLEPEKFSIFTLKKSLKLLTSQ